MIAAAAAALMLLVAAEGSPAGSPATSPGNVPEPPGIYMGPMHGYTPSTLKGATVVDPAKLASLMKSDQPVMLDVAEADRKPAGLSPDRPWSPRHHAIPGTVWLPGAGRGALPAASKTLFEKRVAALAGGDKARPIAVYCHPDCWGSWNAAKRLVLAGYTRVYWLPEGLEGWQEDHPTTVVKPDAEWTAAPVAVGQ